MERTLLFGWGLGYLVAVRAEVPAGTTVGELVRACAAASEAHLEGELVIWCSSPAGSARVLDPAMAVEESCLRSGDAVEVRGLGVQAPMPAVAAAAAPGATAELVAVGGPQCGSRWPLAPGRNSLGRDARGRLQVGGGGATRLATVGISAGPVVRLADTAAVLRVDGDAPSIRRDDVAPGAWIRVGADLLTVRAVPDRHAQHGGDRLRPPRVGVPVAPSPVEMPEPPAPPPRSSVPAGAVLAPAVFAVVIALVTRNPVFLLFGALAPVAGAWRLVADRRSGRRSHRRALRRHAHEMQRVGAELDAAQAAVRLMRRAAMPDPAALVDRALHCRPTVWERRPQDGDFLEVRVGTGDMASRVVVRPRSAGPAVDVSVPASVALGGGAVLGIAGPPRERTRLARWIALQAAVLHSPEEVAIAVSGGAAARAWAWTRLLPHHVDAGDVLDHAAATREGATERHLLVVVEADTTDRAETALAQCAGPHVSLVWCAPSRERLPGSCTDVVVVDTAGTARLSTAADPGAAAEMVPDGVGAAACLAAARALSGRAEGSGMEDWGRRHVGFVEALAHLTGIAADDVDAVASLWSRDEPERLPCLIGSARTGLVSADLVGDGPHALVVGTTGSGKSELFTTMLASVAVAVSPRRLALLLVDFKGGAAFDRLAALPHTAGVVTDLDGALSQRVLVSLDAELRRRMQLLRDLGVVDVAACERSHPAASPPRLVVVVDEFAALTREVPDFVGGLVDVARRGRSLGVHLLVGTQQPDAHTAKLADNTNLRVCMRVQDAAVSREVVGTSRAARFPREARGRAVVARGHGDSVEVQAVWAGQAAERAATLDVRMVGASAGAPAAETVPGGRTELDVVVDAVVEAWRRDGGDPHPHSVWVPPPPAHVPLEGLPVGAPGAPVVGVADEAHRQRLAPMRLDLGSWGSVLVLGRSGSGRTTFLRTAAHAVVRAGGVALYALDCGDGGLADLAALAQCAAVVGGAEPERVDRLFAVLDDEAGERASSRRPRTPAVVLVLDGFAAFAAAYEDWTGGHVATLRRLCEDGRGLGIHLVVAGDPASVPGRVRDAFGAVVELSAPGDATGPGGVSWRVATPASTAIAPERRRGRPVSGMAAIEALPTAVARSDVTRPGSAEPVLGIAGDTMRAVTCDLHSVPLFLVAGPMRSGRSTALATLVQGIVAADPAACTVLLAPRRGPLPLLPCWTEAAVGPDACAAAASRLAEQVRSRAGTVDPDAAGDGVQRLVVVVDDAELLADGAAAAALEHVARRCWDADVWLLAAAESHAAARSFGWLVQMRVSRHGLVLQPDPDSDSEVFRVRLPRRRGYTTAAGRGELVAGGAVRLVQVAH